jgi:outer membrane protein assembly factor BamB
MLQSWYTVAGGALAFPPLGIVLLWMKQARLRTKLAVSLLILLVGVAELFLLYGMRIELRGGGTPSLTFHDPKRHIEELEQSRLQQAASATPTPAAEPAPSAPSVATSPAPVASPEATPSPAAAVAEDKPASAPWPFFRGPQWDGVYRQGPIRTTWPSAGLERIYKQPIGGGYASFVIAGDRAFTIEQRRDKEVVAAYDFKTGKELWTHAYPALFSESMGGDGPRATPTWHDGRLYSLGATGELRVLDDKTGKVLWSKNILADASASNIMWGMSASPLIVDNLVVVQPGGSSANSIVAYDRQSGKKVWGALNDKASYTSPMLVTFDGKRQIITATASRLVGLDPDSGKLLWEHPWVTQYEVNASQPILIDANRFLISSGYGHGAALIEVKNGTAKTIWENTRMKNRFNTSVLHNGYIYGMDESILACLRVSDGNQMWKGGRYGYGQLLLAGDHLIVLSESGELALVKATPEGHQELAKFDAIEGKTWNVPAMADGYLLVRNLAEMALFRIGQ